MQNNYFNDKINKNLVTRKTTFIYSTSKIPKKNHFIQEK